MKKITHEAIWDAILKRIRALLAAKGITQAKIADQLGVDKGTVTRWLNGTRMASKSNPEVIVGYMRALGMNPADYFADDAENSFTEIPWLSATASMGGGSYEGSKEIQSHLSFQTSWLMSKTSSPSSLVVINASGGSMEPTIPDRSVVLIDESKSTDLADGKIYFVCHGQSLFLKRLTVDNDGKAVRLLSDRGDPAIELDGSEYFEVIGQALWFGRDL